MYAKLSGSRCQYGVGVVKTLCDVRTYEVQLFAVGGTINTPTMLRMYTVVLGAYVS